MAAPPEQAPFGELAPGPARGLLLSLVRNSKLRRGAFRPLMSKLMGAAPVDTRFQGSQFRLHHRDSATESGALFSPLYNAEELDFFRAHTGPGDVFVDVGANAGIFTFPMARHVGPTGRVIAIEPHPTVFSRLQFNMRANAPDNVTLLNMAAGDRDGELMIVTEPANLGACHIGDAGTPVRARTLQHILQDLGVAAVAAIKVDVEGFEDRVLIPFFRDAPASLWPRALTLEHLERARWHEDCCDFIASCGYRESQRTRSNTFFLRNAI